MAQNTFVKEYSYDLAGISVNPTLDGGYLIAGNWGPGGYEAGILIRTDSLGDTLWTKQFPLLVAGINAAMQTKDSGTIVTGRINLPGNRDVFMAKFNQNGDTVWSRNFGGANFDETFSVEEVSGGYVFTGTVDGPLPASSWTQPGNTFLLLTDSLGDTLSTRMYSFPYPSYGNSILKTTDGGYLIIGVQTITNPFNVTNSFIIKTDTLGNLQWIRGFEGANINDYTILNAGCRTHDGGFLLVGSRTTNPNTDTYLIRTDSLGDTLWTKTYRLGYSYAHAVEPTSDGGFIVMGDQVLTGSALTYLMKTDSMGQVSWTKYYPGSLYFSEQTSRPAMPTSDGGFVFAASTPDSLSSPVLLLVKTDSIGTAGCLAASATPAQFQVATVVTQPTVIVDYGSRPIGKIATSLSTAAFTISNPCLGVGLNDPSLIEVNIYPNPTSGYLEIQADQPIAGVEVSDELGQVVLKPTPTERFPSVKLDITPLSPGLYFLVIRGDHGMLVRKIIRM